MPTATFKVRTTLAPQEVLAVLTDFGPDRSRHWANTSDSHFKVHELGPDWAEVTEGNALGWERERYSWDAAAGTITIETLDSNLWAPGSGWRYELRPTSDGTEVEGTVTRVAKSMPGRLVGALIPIAGSWTLGRQLRAVLAKAETS